MKSNSLIGDCSVDNDESAKAIINDLNISTAERKNKSFGKLRDSFALRGYMLQRTDSLDGPTTYFAERSGLISRLSTIEDAQDFLTKTGDIHGA